jgi:hypothetical protein
VSLGEVSEIYATLQEIDVMLGKMDVKIESLKVEAGHCTSEAREAEYIFYRLTSLMTRMGLPPQINQAMQKIERMILIIRMMHSAFIFLESTTPYGLILGILTIGGLAITSTDYVMNLGE